MLRPTGLSGIVAVDRDAMTVTALRRHPAARCSTPSSSALGLSPAQHGRHRRADPGRRHLDRHPRHRRRRGRRCPRRSPAWSWSPAPARCCGPPPTRTPTSSTLARVGLGALGVLTTITFRVEPLFLLEAHEQPMRWDEALDGVRRAGRPTHHHVDMYWFPHTDRMLTKRNDRLDAGLDEAEPLSRLAVLARTTSSCPTRSSAR